MSPPRFYVNSLALAGQLSLTSDDARHAQSVLRLKTDDEVELFDGKGLQAVGRIVRTGRSQIEVSIQETQAVSRELNNKLELLVALPKGDRQKQLVDLLVQLGVDQLTPLECDRSVAQPTENALERLRRSVIESSKQCGRNQLMKINQPTRIQSLATETRAAVPDHTHENLPSQPNLRLFAHPYGSSGSLIEKLQRAADCRLNAQAVIGPEGGLTSDECQLLVQSGWNQVSLGKRILRIETAAVMIAATWAAIA